VVAEDIGDADKEAEMATSQARAYRELTD